MASLKELVDKLNEAAEMLVAIETNKVITGECDIFVDVTDEEGEEVEYGEYKGISSTNGKSSTFTIVIGGNYITIGYDHIKALCEGVIERWEKEHDDAH